MIQAIQHRVFRMFCPFNLHMAAAVPDESVKPFCQHLIQASEIHDGAAQDYQLRVIGMDQIQDARSPGFYAFF